MSISKKDFLKIICDTYHKYFPDRKIYAAEKLGHRLSYLAGAGEELFVKAIEIPIGEKYIIFIESKEKIQVREKETLKSFFRSILEEIYN